ncbi:MAG: Gfo/Idh/MocA family oxidoreductase [Bacteroidales bacterium]|nr:Gfo/Idh/MocA family oxidoreductase [Bacteroidales bacterium]
MRITGKLFVSLLCAAVFALPSFAQGRIGIIGLDTSHSIAFTKIVNSDQATYAPYKVVAAYPRGSYVIESAYSRIPKYTEEMKGYGVKITSSIEEMLDMVDCVLLETNDGHLHLEQAAKVFKAGKKIYIDKPIGATLAQAIAIYTLAERYGITFFSSSVVRFSEKNQRIRAGEFGKIIAADCYSPHHATPTHPDFGYYGLHGVEELYTVMGPGCDYVSRVHTDEGDIVSGVWKDGRTGSFRAIRKGPSIYGGTAFTEKKAISTGGVSNGYKPLVDAIIGFFKTGVCPIDKEETLEIFTFMEASNESVKQNGKAVSLAPIRKKAEKEAQKLLKQYK